MFEALRGTAPALAPPGRSAATSAYEQGWPSWLSPALAKTENDPLGPSVSGAFEPGNPLMGGMADGD